ncbi:MAG: hypothetical protein WBF89_14200 [Steroidobacteraceae bacterium]
MKKALGFVWACLFAAMAAAAFAATPGESAAPARIEARSADLLAVGLVRGDRMTIHLSRVIDNAPVRDAAVTVLLRGASHPATAETDGSYTLQSKDLALPGAAAVEIEVVDATGRERLKGTLQVSGAAGRTEDGNSARQLGWWVLNFAVCIGFLWLFSRRRKSAQD